MPTTLRDLRDRALIATLTYSFARISAALKMKVEDLRPRGAGAPRRPGGNGGEQSSGSKVSACSTQRASASNMIAGKRSGAHSPTDEQPSLVPLPPGTSTDAITFAQTDVETRPWDAPPKSGSQ
jgi:hypothetical protein